MPSTGECPSGESGSAWSWISPDRQHLESFSRTHLTGDAPGEPMPSRLSDILERDPDPKYRLSAKACQGILNRAQRRGKELPEKLEKALVEQSLALSRSGEESAEAEKEP